MKNQSRFLYIMIAFFVLFLSGCFNTDESFKISFESNGGTSVGVITFESIQQFDFPQIPTKEGFTFEGWYWDNESFENPLSVESLLNYLDDDNLIVYAKWIDGNTPLSTQLQAIYQLVLEASTFTGTYEEWLESVRGPQGDPGEDGKSVILRLDQDMIQWQLEGDTTWINLFDTATLNGEDGLGIVDAQINEFGEFIISYSDDTQVNLGVLLDAHTVIFKDMFGYVIDITVVNHEEAASAPSIPDIDGYTFSHWDLNFSVVLDHMTITAIYTINEYTITLDYGDEQTTVQIDDVVHGSSINLPIPEREGLIFKGWFFGHSINDGQVTNQTLFYQSLTIYARWEALSLDVAFYDMNGEVIEEFTVSTGDTVDAPAAPNITGYTFIGWNQDFDYITSDLSIYPIYEINQYMISFDSVGGSSVDHIILDYGSSVSEPTPPTKEGFAFSGWFLDIDYEYPYTFTTIKDYNEILYAKWEVVINEFNLTIVDEIGSTITINLGIYGQVTMNGYDLIIHYDESIIQYVSHANILSNVVNATTPGMIRLNYSNISSYLQDGQIIMSIVFEWVVTSYTDLWIEVIEAVIVDENYNVFVVETNTRGLEISYQNEG